MVVPVSSTSFMRTVRPAVVLLPGLLAAVAAAEMPQFPVPNSIETVTVEALQPRYVAPTLRDRIGRIWAPVYINDQGPYRLVLDTGANRSAVIDRVAVSLGSGVVTAANAQLRGTTGTAVVPMIDVERLQIGDLLIEATQLPILPDAFGGADGVLGYDGLKDKRIFIDFGNDLITIKRSQRERPAAGFTSLPITFLQDFVPTINVYLGSLRIKAIIDTGAQRSMGNSALYELLQRRRREFADSTVTGVTLDDQAGQATRLHDIRMGDVTIPSLQVTFGDLYIFQYWKVEDVPVLILGMDVLGTVNKLVIDYRRREVHMQVRSRRAERQQTLGTRLP